MRGTIQPIKFKSTDSNIDFFHRTGRSTSLSRPIKPAILKSADLTKISSSFRSFFSIFQFFFHSISISMSISPCFYFHFHPYFNYILSTFIMNTLFILINFILERIRVKIQFIVICLQVFVKKNSDKDFRNCNKCFETFYVVRSLS